MGIIGGVRSGAGFEVRQLCVCVVGWLVCGCWLSVWGGVCDASASIGGLRNGTEECGEQQMCVVCGGGGWYAWGAIGCLSEHWGVEK